MNVISAKPDLEDFDVRFGLQFGELDRRAGDVRVNLPISESFAARAAIVVDDRDDGYFKDSKGNILDTESYQAFRLALRWQPSDKIDINYVFDTQDEEMLDTVYIVKEHLAVTGSEFNSLIDSPSKTQNDVFNHNLTIDLDTAGGTFSSVSNYREREIYDLSDADYFFPSAFFAFGFNRQQAQKVDNEIFFQEVRYVADGSERFNWLVGADYYTQDNVERVSNYRGVLGLPADAGVWGNAQDRVVDLGIDSWAAYASAEYKFDTVPFSLSAEVRYAVDEVGGRVLTDRVRLAQPETDITAAPKKFKNLPWGVTASYAFEDGLGDAIRDAMVYAKVASAYRHGGLNLSAGSPGLDKYVAVLTYDEEDSLTYELGFKSTLAGGLTFNFAAFKTVYDNFLNTTSNGCPDQCQYIDLAGNGLGFNPDGSRIEVDALGNPGVELPTAFFIDNVGGAEAWGMEAELAWVMGFDNGAFLNIRGGWSKQLGEVTELAADVDPTSAFIIGKRLPYMRPQEFKGSIVYSYPLPALADMAPFLQGAALLTTANFTVEKGGIRTLPTAGALADFQDDVRRVDMRIGLDTDKWSLMLRGDNVLDAGYETFSAFATPTERSTLYRRSVPAYYSLEFAWRLR